MNVRNFSSVLLGAIVGILLALVFKSYKTSITNSKISVESDLSPLEIIRDSNVANKIDAETEKEVSNMSPEDLQETKSESPILVGVVKPLDIEYFNSIEDIVNQDDLFDSLRILTRALRISSGDSFRTEALREAMHKTIARILERGVTVDEIASNLSKTRSTEGFGILGTILGTDNPPAAITLINKLKNESEAASLTKTFFASYFDGASPERSGELSDWILQKFNGAYTDVALSSLASAYRSGEHFADSVKVSSLIVDERQRLDAQASAISYLLFKAPDNSLDFVRSISDNPNFDQIEKIFFRQLSRSNNDLADRIQNRLSEREKLLLMESNVR